MPPPIEEEEEEDFEQTEALASGEDVLESQEGDSPQELSPVLVISDIVASSAIPARIAQPDMSSGEKGKKRPIDPRSNLDPLAKRRRGDKRELPCTYCVRRLAKDPSWACHDARMSQNGIGAYTGFRCSECVGAHTPCQLIPSKAKVAVETLVRAAADLVASDGTDNISLLAAYEAAVRPALRETIVIPTGKDLHPEKKRKSNSLARASSTPKHRSEPTTNGAGSSYNRSFSPAVPAAPSPAGYQDDHQQQEQPQFYTTQQPQYLDADFERLERQALRRRKVEALESLAHTAALFLAEYMTANKKNQTPPAGAGSRPAEDKRRDQGANYAAAAAGMIANLYQPGQGQGGVIVDDGAAATISNCGRAGGDHEEGRKEDEVTEDRSLGDRDPTRQERMSVVKTEE